MEQISSLKQADIVTQDYINLLEKTNQQLSLWSNPYGFMVSVLSVLFTVLTVVAAFLIWKQSRDQKEAFKEALLNYENRLEESLSRIGSDAELKIQSLIDIKTKEIDSLSGDTKKQARKIIDDLKKEKDSISSRIQFSSVQGNSTISSYNGSFPHLTTFGGTGGVGGATGTNIFYTAPSGATTTRLLVCPQCGSYIPDSTSFFCGKCGVKLSSR